MFFNPWKIGMTVWPWMLTESANWCRDCWIDLMKSLRMSFRACSEISTTPITSAPNCKRSSSSIPILSAVYNSIRKFNKCGLSNEIPPLYKRTELCSDFFYSLVAVIRCNSSVHGVPHPNDDSVWTLSYFWRQPCLSMPTHK